jgi:hypothetical protein
MKGETSMIVILPTTTGFVVGVSDTPEKAWKSPSTLRTAEHLPPAQRRRHQALLKRWMRLGKAHAN